jgi:predicted peptidase
MTYKIIFFVMSAIGLTVLFPFFARAQDNSAFDKGTYINKNDTLPYRILFPVNFDASKKYPLVLVLHGAGERGNDNEAQLRFGARAFLNDTTRAKYPAIVVFPQCPKNGFWSNVDKRMDSDGKTTYHFLVGENLLLL